jgi:hypothetical protein
MRAEAPPPDWCPEEALLVKASMAQAQDTPLMVGDWNGGVPPL